MISWTLHCSRSDCEGLEHWFPPSPVMRCLDLYRSIVYRTDLFRVQHDVDRGFPVQPDTYQGILKTLHVYCLSPVILSFL